MLHRDESEDASESSSSSSGWESADELEHHHVPLKSYRRPLRPQATSTTSKITAENLDPKRKRLRQKRERNRSNVNVDLATERPPPPSSSHYLRLCERENQQLHIPKMRPPTGFACLLNQVSEKAKSMRNGREAEEIIGDSSSSSAGEDEDKSAY